MKNTVSGSLFKELLTMVFSYFKIENPHIFPKFSKGVEFYTQYLFLQDQIIDQEIDFIKEGREEEDSTLFYCHQFHQKSIVSLVQVFPKDHEFWEILERKEKQYFNGLTKEKFLSHTKSTVTLPVFEHLAISKHILSVVPIRGMFFLGVTQLDYEVLEKIFSFIFCGIQMLDDLDDFDKDLKSGQWNYIQHEVEKIIVSEGLMSEKNIGDLEKKVLYAADIAEFALEYSIKKFSEASVLALDSGLFEINEWLSQMIKETEHQKKYILSLL